MYCAKNTYIYVSSFTFLFITLIMEIQASIISIRPVNLIIYLVFSKQLTKWTETS